MRDPEFHPNAEALQWALRRLCQADSFGHADAVPTSMPEQGMGATPALEMLAPHVLGGAARLDDPLAAAHMDPPTPWITWAATQWNARLNQNLLHLATAPVAREIEARVVHWLAPFFGMNGGHMTPGATLANLTALWAARDGAGVREVFASAQAHLSIAKAARILGLSFRALPTDARGALLPSALPEDLSRSALVLTAGTTSSGVIDPLSLIGRAAWTHVDAAWAGPLRLTRFASRLEGIERTDSVAVSAHKWLFQPKESALVLFRDTEAAHAAVSEGGAYLAVPNVGILGSHGATAVPLLATLLAWGREGMAQRIEACMMASERLAEGIHQDDRLALRDPPQTGILNWRPRDVEHFERWQQALPVGLASTTTLHGERWFRQVFANPNADAERILEVIRSVRS